MKNKIKKLSTAIALISIGVIVGIAMPIVVKGENGEATSAQVLKGKTFTSSLVGIAKEGAIEDFSKSIITKSVNATNDNFIETIELTPGYYDQIQVNTEAVYNAGKADGASASSLSTYSSSLASSTLHSYYYGGGNKFNVDFNRTNDGYKGYIIVVDAKEAAAYSIRTPSVSVTSGSANANVKISDMTNSYGRDGVPTARKSTFMILGPSNSINIRVSIDSSSTTTYDATVYLYGFK